MRMGLLSIVATPIGNLEDVTVRALRTLREADYIYCEDTRVTRRLCEKYEIPTPLISLNAHSEEKKIAEVMAHVRNGAHVAYVSDAGTPGISDPGVRLVSAMREARLPVEAVPGPSAVVAALSVAGVDTSIFTFFGFIPHKKGRQTLFATIAHTQHTAVMYESPHRITKTLESLCEYVPTRRVCLVRELTKVYEEVISGMPAEVLATLRSEPEKQKGEFVVIVDGA